MQKPIFDLMTEYRYYYYGCGALVVPIDHRKTGAPEPCFVKRFKDSVLGLGKVTRSVETIGCGRRTRMPRNDKRSNKRIQVLPDS